MSTVVQVLPLFAVQITILLLLWLLPFLDKPMSIDDEARRTQAAVRQINRRAREDMLRLAAQRQADRPVGRATVPGEYIDAESYWS